MPEDLEHADVERRRQGMYQRSRSLLVQVI
jgi:hypothetical protein